MIEINVIDAGFLGFTHIVYNAQYFLKDKSKHDPETLWSYYYGIWGSSPNPVLNYLQGKTGKMKTFEYVCFEIASSMLTTSVLVCQNGGKIRF